MGTMMATYHWRISAPIRTFRLCLAIGFFSSNIQEDITAVFVVLRHLAARNRRRHITAILILSWVKPAHRRLLLRES